MELQNIPCRLKSYKINRNLLWVTGIIFLKILGRIMPMETSVRHKEQKRTKIMYLLMMNYITTFSNGLALSRRIEESNQAPSKT